MCPIEGLGRVRKLSKNKGIFVKQNKDNEEGYGGTAPTPTGGHLPLKSKYHAGGELSRVRLATLKFDPIGEAVETYRKLQEAIRYQEAIRDGDVIELRLDGKPKAFSLQLYLGLIDRMQRTQELLIRYGYGRVPETLNVQTNAPPSLVVNLTKKGETYKINESDDEALEAPSLEPDDGD